MSKFINKAADGGITALHMAALNGYYDCVHLLLDLHANVSAVTFHYGTSMDLIGNSLKLLLLNLMVVCDLSTFINNKWLYPYNRSWKHSIALCSLWGKLEVLSGKTSL